MKYDDASWHYEGEFPSDLPKDRAATHIGMFFCWIVDSGLVGQMHREEFFNELERIKGRQMTGAQFIMEFCDGQLTDEDMNDQGNEFTSVYYEEDFLEDYEEFLGEDCETLYHIDDSWNNYDRLKIVIDRRFASWKQHDENV